MIKYFQFLLMSGMFVSSAVADTASSLSIAQSGPGMFELSWPTNDKTPYQLVCSPDLSDWEKEGDLVLGTGGMATVQVTQNGPKCFFDLLAGAVRPGFDGICLEQNDDESYQGGTSSPVAVPLGFNINFYGDIVTECYVNNNGNITFDGALKEFTPLTFGTLNRKIIAPFWGDVDTRGIDSGVVCFTSGGETADGRPAFGVTYRNVGYYDKLADKLNTFQVVLIDRSDIGPGDFDIEFNYARVAWETGSASGGVNGYGGSSARAGLANGEGLYFEYQGSGVVSAFLDSDPDTSVPNLNSGLIYQQFNSLVPGRIVLPVRNGEVEQGFEVDAGSDMLLDAGAGSKLQLQGFVEEGATYTWIQQSGPGTATITPVDALNPTVTIPRPGIWEFKLTGVKQGEFVVTSCDTVVVDHPGNFDVFAGFDKNIEGDGKPVSLIFDEALAVFGGVETVDVVWEKVSGPDASFTDETVIQAEVELTSPGFYQFQVTGTTTHDETAGSFTMVSYVDVEYLQLAPPPEAAD